jgi:hypothetical protein
MELGEFLQLVQLCPMSVDVSFYFRRRLKPWRVAGESLEREVPKAISRIKRI